MGEGWGEVECGRTKGIASRQGGRWNVDARRGLRSDEQEAERALHRRGAREYLMRRQMGFVRSVHPQGGCGLERGRFIRREDVDWLHGPLGHCGWSGFGVHGKIVMSRSVHWESDFPSARQRVGRSVNWEPVDESVGPWGDGGLPPLETGLGLGGWVIGGSGQAACSAVGRRPTQLTPRLCVQNCVDVHGGSWWGRHGGVWSNRSPKLACTRGRR
eukprot:227243-Chlamydomonas_euryale.AAC.11